MTDHRIPANALEPSRYNQRGHYSTPHLGAHLRLIVAGSQNPAGFGLGYVDATGTARRKYGADPEPGPWAYAVPQASVMSNDGRGTGWEIDQARNAGLLLEVKVGDRLVMPDGETFTVDFARGWGGIDRHNIELTHVG